MESLAATCAQPRRPNRAKCHLVTAADFAQWLPNTKLSTRWTDFDAWFAFEDDADAVQTALDGLRSRNADLHRGDIVVFQPFAGYRNGGKLIFNGARIIPLDHDIVDEYGAVPPEFQILNVPPGSVDPMFGPKYWSDIIDHNRSVPFNFMQHLPTKTTRDAVRENGHFVLTFTGPDGASYFIVEETPDSVVDALEFLQRLTETPYVDWAYVNSAGRAYGEGGELPEGMDAEHVLMLSDSWI